MNVNYWNESAHDWTTTTARAVETALGKETLGPADFAALLSPAAEPYLEEIAQRAHQLTVRHFGRTMLLYTPLYLSDYCANRCLYCGFSSQQQIPRHQLDFAQVEAEGKAIAASGLRHLLLLTGEAPARAGLDYMATCLRILRPYFASLALGTNVPNMPSSLVLNVPGYGNIAFSSGNNSQLEVVSMSGSSGPTKSINMNGGETLIANFLGATPINVNFGYEEVDPGETMTSLAPFSPSQFIVSMNGNNAGVSAVNFQVVPEPSAILLGGIGSLLLFRRRRA